MSDPVTLTSSIFRDRRPAQQQLGAAVHDLTWARCGQLLLEQTGTGLFCGLLAASGWVALVRIFPLALNPWVGAAVIVVLSVAVAAMIAWQRRPDSLQVAILADVEMGLQQKLSTAWELKLAGADAALVERLAVQATHSVNIPRRCAYVFPRRANLWGKLTPVGAMLLLLVGLVEVPRHGEREAGDLDSAVVEEGGRLREYGREMELRASRLGLARSEDQSRSVQRLGTRMAGGHLDRARALARLGELSASLDTQRTLARSEGVAPWGVHGAPGTPGEPRTRAIAELRASLEQLLEGQADPGDLEALRGADIGLSGPAIGRQNLQDALDRLAAGDQEALREIVDDLRRLEQSFRDAGELDSAAEQVLHVRENLGDSNAPEDRAAARDAPGMPDGEGETGMLIGPRGEQLPGDRDVRIAVYATTRGSGRQSDASQRADPRSRQPSDAPRVLIRPDSQLGEGVEFSASGRVLPQGGAVAIQEIPLDPAFSAQVEEVMSREDVPLHEKELVRRYFLSLSEGMAEQSKPRDGGNP